MRSSQQLVENLKKTYKKSEDSDCIWNEKQDTILSQVNARENSRQPIANTQRGDQPLAPFITKRLDSIQINYQIIILGRD